MAEGELTSTGAAPPVEPVPVLFRAVPERDPHDTGSACRFLALETPDGSFQPPTAGVDAANRCVSLGEPVPQSSRQQQLVCLTVAHRNCPRFLRGVLLAHEPLPPPRREPTSPAVIGAALVLAAALAASFGFLAVRGGFAVPLGSGSPAPVVVAGGPTSTASSTIAPPPSAPPSASPSPSPSPSPTPAPTASASATPAPTPPLTPTPAPAATPTASSDRYALLTKCPSQPDCWIYVIRSGDNLQSIANWFGVSLDRMLAMNPDLRTPIHAGDRLRISTPTR